MGLNSKFQGKRMCSVTKCNRSTFSVIIIESIIVNSFRVSYLKSTVLTADGCSVLL